MSLKLLTIIGIGVAMSRMPETQQRALINLPIDVTGTMSPYPTVVIEITAHLKLKSHFHN